MKEAKVKVRRLKIPHRWLSTKHLCLGSTPLDSTGCECGLEKEKEGGMEQEGSGPNKR